MLYSTVCRVKLKHVHYANTALALRLVSQAKQLNCHYGGSCWDSHAPERVWLLLIDYFEAYYTPGTHSHQRLLKFGPGVDSLWGEDTTCGTCMG